MYPEVRCRNDGFVQKISEYISKKVADKTDRKCVKTDRESYEKYWDDISPFINLDALKTASSLKNCMTTFCLKMLTINI